MDSELENEKIIQILPDNAEPYKDLGVLYGIEKKYDKAVSVFKKAAELDPKDAQVRQNLAITYQILENTKNESLKGKDRILRLPFRQLLLCAIARRLEP